MVNKIDTAKEYFADLIEGTSTIMDIDAIMTIKGKLWLMDYKNVTSDKATPFTSELAKYPYKWRPIVRLINIAKKLNAYVAIIAFSEKYPDEIKVTVIDDYYPEMLRNYEYMSTKEMKDKHLYLEYYHVVDERKFTYDEFKEWINERNKETLKNMDLLNGDI